MWREDLKSCAVLAMCIPVSARLLWLTLRTWCWRNSELRTGATSLKWSRRRTDGQNSWSEGWPARATPQHQRSALLRFGSSCKAWCRSLEYNRERFQRWNEKSYLDKWWGEKKQKIKLTLMNTNTMSVIAVDAIEFLNPNEIHSKICK